MCDRKIKLPSGYLFLAMERSTIFYRLLSDHLFIIQFYGPWTSIAMSAIKVKSPRVIMMETYPHSKKPRW